MRIRRLRLPQRCQLLGVDELAIWPLKIVNSARHWECQAIDDKVQDGDQKKIRLSKPVASAARAAGYAEAQADLVLTLMLSEEGRKVLEGLAAIAEGAGKADAGEGNA